MHAFFQSYGGFSTKIVVLEEHPKFAGRSPLSRPYKNQLDPWKQRKGSSDRCHRYLALALDGDRKSGQKDCPLLSVRSLSYLEAQKAEVLPGSIAFSRSIGEELLQPCPAPLP